jgi:hypothetical protein
MSKDGRDQVQVSDTSCSIIWLIYTLIRYDTASKFYIYVSSTVKFCRLMVHDANAEMIVNIFIES